MDYNVLFREHNFEFHGKMSEREGETGVKKAKAEEQNDDDERNVCKYPMLRWQQTLEMKLDNVNDYKYNEKRENTKITTKTQNGKPISWRDRETCCVSILLEFINSNILLNLNGLESGISTWFTRAFCAQTHTIVHKSCHCVTSSVVYVLHFCFVHSINSRYFDWFYLFSLSFCFAVIVSVEKEKTSSGDTRTTANVSFGFFFPFLFSNDMKFCEHEHFNSLTHVYWFVVSLFSNFLLTNHSHWRKKKPTNHIGLWQVNGEPNTSTIRGVGGTNIGRYKYDKERKLGHRRVGYGGEITYKKIQSSHIMGSIQLGIQHTVRFPFFNSSSIFRRWQLCRLFMQTTANCQQ